MNDVVADDSSFVGVAVDGAAVDAIVLGNPSSKVDLKYCRS